MKIYFNWLGEWVELNDDIDFINDMSPSTFIKSISKLNKRKDVILYEKTLIIKKENYEYHIPSNLLVWKEKLSDFVNEEKWA